MRVWPVVGVCVWWIAVVYAEPGKGPSGPADLISLTSACADTKPLERIALPETVTQALHLQPELLIAEANEQASRADVHAAKSKFLPQIELSGLEEQFVPSNGNTPVVVVGNNVLGGPRINSAYASLGLTWNLWNNGEDVAALGGARAGMRSAVSDVDNQLGDTLLGVLKAYTELYVAEVDATNDAEASASLAAIQAQAERRYARGYATEVDVGQARVAVFTANQRLNTACRDLDGKSATLAQAAGIEMDSVHGLRTLSPPPRPEQEAGALTIEERIEASPAVVAAQENVLAAQSEVRRTRGEFGPKLELTLQKDFLGQDPYSFVVANRRLAAADYRVGLQLTVPLPPYDAEEADVAKAHAQLHKAQASYQQARIEAQTSILEAISAQRMAERSLEAAQNNLADAEQILVLTEAQFRAGRKDRDAVEHALMDRNTAQANVAELDAQRVLSEWMAVRAQFPQQFPAMLLDKLHLDVQTPNLSDAR